MAKHRVLFVCLGNICRSPMAEGVLRRVAQEEGVLDRFEIDSAGLGNWHVGQAPDSRAQEAASRRGTAISDQFARQATKQARHRYFGPLCTEGDEGGLRALRSAARHGRLEL